MCYKNLENLNWKMITKCVYVSFSESGMNQVLGTCGLVRLESSKAVLTHMDRGTLKLGEMHIFGYQVTFLLYFCDPCGMQHSNELPACVQQCQVRQGPVATSVPPTPRLPREAQLSRFTGHLLQLHLVRPRETLPEPRALARRQQSGASLHA